MEAPKRETASRSNTKVNSTPSRNAAKTNGSRGNSSREIGQRGRG
jgi:hypothetical protein